MWTGGSCVIAEPQVGRGWGATLSVSSLTGRRGSCPLGWCRSLWVSGPPPRPSRGWRRRGTYPQRWSSWIFGRVWSLNRNANQGPDDDRRDDEPAHAALQELGCRFAARDGGFAAQRLMQLEVESL